MKRKTLMGCLGSALSAAFLVGCVGFADAEAKGPDNGRHRLPILSRNDWAGHMHPSADNLGGPPPPRPSGKKPPSAKNIPKKPDRMPSPPPKDGDRQYHRNPAVTYGEPDYTLMEERAWADEDGTRHIEKVWRDMAGNIHVERTH